MTTPVAGGVDPEVSIEGDIPTVEAVVVEQYKPDSTDPANPKGQRTWNFPLGTPAEDGWGVVAKRLLTDTVGGHFHSRPTLDKDPEWVIVILGQCEFEFEDLSGAKRTCLVDPKHGPILVKIPPYILHKVRVVSREIWFLEFLKERFNSRHNHSEATFRSLAAKVAASDATGRSKPLFGHEWPS